MKKFLTLAGLTLSLAASFTLASAQEGQQPQQPRDEQRRDGGGPFGRRGHRGHARKGGHIMRALSRLNLTDAQRTQIHSINEATRQRTEAQRKELRQLFETHRHDGSQITSDQQARVQQLSAELRATRESANQQILALLTAEQRAQLEQWQQERHTRGPGLRKQRRPADTEQQ